MIRIPKIIHQTWKDENLPKAFQVLSETWREKLPGWEYRLWTDEMNREFVRTHYPDFLEKYDAYPKNIQRADAIRYLLLQTYGGLYVDLDFECLEPEFVSLLEDADFVIGKEPYAHSNRYGMEYIVCNALMASVPNHPFLKKICDVMMSHPHGWNVRNKIDVLDSTGPFLVTNVYKGYSPKDNVKLIEPECIYPIQLGEAKLIFEDNIPDEMVQRINAAYALHYFCGSWWNSNRNKYGK